MTETNTIALKQMENGGYVKEGTGTTCHNQDIQPSAPAIYTVQPDLSSPPANCPCVESTAVCNCKSDAPPKSKVELLTWVRPKGWLLLGITVGFLAWSAIFFTLVSLNII
ncbi:hypothetical protein Hamer_G018783 [Homarus americanus]|uniref:Uncharacterized protein n=1 Tax=Homarus americanus TaxID=6706 RepID=A0A8J5MN92_HOMAM|nr:hypothetical protein Hamer_G018783 [Homarus americanus]